MLPFLGIIYNGHLDKEMALPLDEPRNVVEMVRAASSCLDYGWEIGSPMVWKWQQLVSFFKRDVAASRIHKFS